MLQRLIGYQRPPLPSRRVSPDNNRYILGAMVAITAALSLYLHLIYIDSGCSHNRETDNNEN